MKADTGSEYLFLARKKHMLTILYPFLSNFAYSQNQGIRYIIIGTIVI